MTQPYRLPNGGRIDRSRPLAFSWDGRSLQGYAGDTLASALLANGIHFVARSFKYHRPRGILAAGAEEPNALVTLIGEAGREDPNTRATLVPLHEGLRAFSQNCWPSLKRDLYALNGIIAPLVPAGFYYKTFMHPRGAWAKLYEPAIRRTAGLGRAPSAPDPDRYSKRFAHCDVLVVGAGSAGIAAASAAANSGAKVILCDDGLAEPRPPPAVTFLSRTTAFGYYADNFLGLLEDLDEARDAALPRQRLWQVRAKQVVLATGAIERPVVFPGNDRPGILLAHAALSYLDRYAVSVGREIVAYAAHDSGYAAALKIHERGGRVRAIVDPRIQAPTELATAAERKGIEVLHHHGITGTEGGHRVTAVSVRHLSSKGARARRLPCDAVLMAGGWTPSVHLFSQTRGELQWNDHLQAFVPGRPRQATWVAGACRGIFAEREAIADGEQTGHAAARAGKSAPAWSNIPPPIGQENLSHVSQLHEIAQGSKSFVDFQNDVCASDIALAIREGFHSMEHVKRYTTTGMATDQGKTSNLNALSIAGHLLNQTPQALGVTTFRPPYMPITFGALAAEHRGMDLDPVRKTPMHAWEEANGAVFEPVSLWMRARYFPKAGEDMHAAVARECRVTRERAGIFDASTLGKIEVVGADAAEFLNRLYTNAWSQLEVGRCRYGLMLREDGFVFDDGVVGRLAAGRFHVTTTTGGAPRVLQHMEDYLQTEFQDLKVWLTSTTEEWAVIAVNGPYARHILEPLVQGIDLAPQSFPHMAIREGRICGEPTRLFRVSFTGELGFEVNVPSSAGAAVWEQIQRSGEQHGAVTYGTEAMHVLRAEKGYIIVGQDTDGTVTPLDLGLGWAIGTSKPDFVGKRSLARPEFAKAERKQLVGLLTSDARTVLAEGAQVVPHHGTQGCPSIGHVTSAYFSPMVGRPIALALIANGRNTIGSKVHIHTPRRLIEAEVVSTAFYDPEGKRLNV